jgi:hypothetical protein
MTATETVQGERADLLDLLGKHRFFLRNTLRDLTDEQAAAHPTVSELCLGGLIKHVSLAERRWADFVVEGQTAMTQTPDSFAEHTASFQMRPGETVASILAEYEQVAARTDDLVRTLPDLDLSHPLPETPWWPPGTRWTARRVFLHIVAETAQHAGHADILRETIDGAKSMG